jgi:hypothetical protein
MKQTRKFASAEKLYNKLSLTQKYRSQDALYEILGEQGYYWERKAQRWQDGGESHPPSTVISISVSTGYDRLSEVAEILTEALEGYDLELIEQSRAYPCRPPKQNDSKMYLTFLAQD